MLMNRKLVSVAVAAPVLIAASMIMVPPPFNYVMSLAICGPLSAAVLGLLHERRTGRCQTT